MIKMDRLKELNYMREIRNQESGVRIILKTEDGRRKTEVMEQKNGNIVYHREHPAAAGLT